MDNRFLTKAFFKLFLLFLTALLLLFFNSNSFRVLLEVVMGSLMLEVSNLLLHRMVFNIALSVVFSLLCLNEFVP